MKSYDDLQRFKEKTQTNDIKFKDMSEQAGESDITHWAIIRQLLSHDTLEPVLGQGQSIDLIHPQPVDKYTFSAPLSAPSSGTSGKPAFSVAPSAAAPARGSLLDSIAAELNTTPAAVSQSAAVEQPPAMERPDSVASAPISNGQQRPVAAAVAPTKHAEPTPRYSSLFSATGTANRVVMTKDTLLKPLLEKIALCR
ncbi:hypothetical protein ED28_07805 [[Pantoea] beijingensis]|uniref:Cellulose biosynthesis protein BcsO n=1 Tax=[Pantoea] beijingensis TaxID=1324864 RepID=A0A443IE35_9GAMM|nr:MULTISPECIES: cellulose biosynthesis protein BcsO [Erwiniaceae]RWR02276.1 hypothetical protein ED28_07805 [[Pantoea] beijingensis]